LFSLPDANAIVPGRNYTALVDLGREGCGVDERTRSKGLRPQKPVPRQKRGTDAKTTGEMKAGDK
jgi:hypothetical protein